MSLRVKTDIAWLDAAKLSLASLSPDATNVWRWSRAGVELLTTDGCVASAGEAVLLMLHGH